MHCLRQLIFLDIILVIFVFADKLDTSEKPQTEATQIGISTTHASQTDNSPDTTGRGCTDNSPDSTCFVGSGSYASTLPTSQTLNAPIATGKGCTDNSPDSTCFVGSGSYASTLPASQTLNAPIATGKGCTGNSPDSTCFVGSGSYASTPHVTATNNSPDTNIGRPTAMETHTSATPCGNICGPVRAAEIVCGRMHPNSNVRYLDCVCASNNATTPIGACSRCKIAQGDLHDSYDRLASYCNLSVTTSALTETSSALYTTKGVNGAVLTVSPAVAAASSSDGISGFCVSMLGIKETSTLAFFITVLLAWQI